MSPRNHVGYTVNTGGRGTLDIIWSSLATIVLCTWTVQRLQVVPWGNSRTIIFRKKVFWMLITLLCPEYVTWIAFDQWQRAQRYKALQELGYKEWTLEMGFYVDMGGFQVLLEAGKEDLVVVNSAVESYGKDKALETVRERELLTAGIVKRGNGDIVAEEGVVRFTIRLEDLISLSKDKILDPPSITTRDLKERSKNDQFARVVTLIQVLYFAIHSFGRLGSNLPVSTLEISVLAFVCCAAFIEFFWWKKPLDIRTPTTQLLPANKRGKFIALLARLRFNTPEQDLAEKIDVKLFFDRIMNGDDMKRNVVHAVWIGCIFNGIHISAWNYSFPTNTERLLWQLASCGACGMVVIVWVASFLRPKILGLVISVLSCAIYCVCRIYLMVEVFAGLRSVPASMYQSVAWENTLPVI